MTRLYKYILVAGAILALSLTGCVSEDSPCPPGESGDDGKAVTLRFTVVTRSADNVRSANAAPDGNGSTQSRADDCYDDQSGTPAENFINTADCQFLLFDADRKLLRPIFPEVTATENTEYTLYSVKATITDPYFENAVKEAGDDGNVKFYIMVIANTHSENFNGQYLSYSPGVTTISDLAAQGKTFDLPPRRDQWNNISIWQPSTNISDKKFIPMSGIQEFDVRASLLKTTSDDAPLDLSTTGTDKDIYMLRAMAKIEVVDKIDMPDVYDPDLQRTVVEKVELVGFYTKGNILPSVGQEGQWPNYVTKQVTGPTVPELGYYTNPVAYSQEYASNNDDNNILMFFEDKIASREHHNGYPVYSAYVTEYDRTSVGNLVKPYIVVTVVNSGDDVSYFKELKLDKYEDGAPVGTGIEALLRNHIYRYEITGVASDINMITVNYTVCDWDMHEVDIPTFE